MKELNRLTVAVAYCLLGPSVFLVMEFRLCEVPKS